MDANIKQIWKDVSGYEGLYKISIYGDVIRDPNSKHFKSNTTKLKVIYDNFGYPIVRLYKNSKGHTKRTHRLLMLHFVPNPNGLRCINHINGNKADNRLENLEWCTHKHNTLHAYSIGKKIAIKGENHAWSKINDFEKQKIFSELLNNNSRKICGIIARQYGVTRKRIEQLRREVFKVTPNL